MCLWNRTILNFYLNLLTYMDPGDVVSEDGRRRRASQGGCTAVFFSQFGQGRRFVDASLPKNAIPARERISELKDEVWWGVDI